MHPEATVTSTPQATSRWKPTDFQRTEASRLITDCFLICLFICGGTLGLTDAEYRKWIWIYSCYVVTGKATSQ